MITTLSLPQSIVATRRGLDLAAAESEHLEDFFHGVIAIQDSTPWMIGDLLIEIEGRLDSSADDDALKSRYKALLTSAREHGYTGTDLFVYRRVCELIPLANRRDFSWALHFDVLTELQNKRKADAESITEWLDYCEKELPDARGRRSRSALRAAMRDNYMAEGITDSPPIPSLSAIIRPFKAFTAALPSALTRENRREILTQLEPVVQFYKEIQSLGE